MSRQDANAAFALSSFLQGANATYIDELYARYEKEPASVDPEWQEFFKSLKDQPADVLKNAQGPSWGRDNWPLTPRDELTSALDGNWAQVEKVIGGKLAAKAQISAEAGAPTKGALAAILAPTTFSTSAQLPSSAEVRSSRGLSGQLFRSQDGPSAFFRMSAGWSFRLLKNSCHSPSTEAGSFS